MSDRQPSRVILTETAPSILRFAAIQCVEGKQELADLAPKNGFVPAEPVVRAARQIGEPQEAARELGGGIEVQRGTVHRFCFGGDAVRCLLRVDLLGIDPISGRANIA